MGKILFDFLFSIIVILLVAPVLIICCLLIIVFMPGPVLFIQQRVGKNGKPFRLFKFRTMKAASDKATGSFDVGDVTRITPLGRFLRKTKLDELPQLINVLIGDMALVGPRPEVKEWTSVYPEKWKIVHSVKPGITDNASIEFRNEEEILAKSTEPRTTYREEILPRKLDLYIDYVHNRSFLGDIRIILKTIIVVIKG